MTKRRSLIYGLLFLLTTISYIDRTTLSVAAPEIAAEFHVSPVEMGYLFSSFLWTYLLCLIPVGLLVDRLGSGLMAAGGITLWSLATVATGVSTSFGFMLLTRLALGVGESTAYPAGVRVIRDSAPESERGVATAWLNGGSYAGPAVGAMLTGWLIAAFGWRAGFIVTGALGLLWLVPWLYWLRTSRASAPVAQAEMENRYRDSRTAGSGVPSGGLAALLRLRSTWGMALTQGCAVYAQYLFLTWLPSYLQAAKGLNVQSAGLYTAIPYAASVLLAIGACHISDRLLAPERIASGQRRRMVALMLLCSSVVLLTPAFDSMWMVTVLVALSLSGISSAISLNFALATDLLQRAEDVGKVAGVLVFGGNFFGILAPIVTGYVIAATGSYNGAFVIAGILLIGGAAASLLMTPAVTRTGDARAVSVT